MTINTQKHKKQLGNKLTADMVQGTRCVLTVETAREEDFDRRSSIVIRFKEFPTLDYATNKGQSDVLMQLVESGFLPAESFELWAGHRIAFYKQVNKNPNTGQAVAKLYPFGPTQQKEAIKEYDALVAAQPAKPAGKK